MGSVKAANTHFSEAETSKSLMSYSAWKMMNYLFDL